MLTFWPSIRQYIGLFIFKLLHLVKKSINQRWLREGNGDSVFGSGLGARKLIPGKPQHALAGGVAKS
jgi:hypothetical protein